MQKIRQAKPEEANLLTNLTMDSKSYWRYSKEFLKKCRPHLLMSEEYINSWPVKVIEIDNEVKGYFSLKVIEGENRLDNLWILPEFIGQGLGSLLFQEVIKEAELLNWKYFRLAGERNAVEFYEKLGAKEIGRVQSRLGKDIFLPHMEYIL